MPTVLRSVALGVALLSCLFNAGGDEIRACADQAEMPPFVYTPALGEAKGQTSISGVSVDLIKLIAAENGWTVRLDLLPWARCLRDAQSGRFDLVLNVGEEEARANQLVLSHDYYRLHGVYLYSYRARPAGVTLKSISDLSRLRVCGMGGYRFESFGIDTNSVDRGTAKSYDQLISKLHLGRCDVAVGSREEIGGMYLNSPKMESELKVGFLGMQSLPGAPERSLYFGIPGGVVGAPQFIKAIDRSLDRLLRRGVVVELVDRHLAAREPRVKPAD